MRCKFEPPDIHYIKFKIEVDALLKQHDHAHGNGNPPKSETKSVGFLNFKTDLTDEPSTKH